MYTVAKSFPWAALGTLVLTNIARATVTIKGAHGEETDFKGEHLAMYNALSAKNLSLNLLTEHDFHSPHSRLNVHGSWVKAAYHSVRTSTTGRLLQIGYRAVEPHRVIITEGCATCRRHVLRTGAPTFTVENVEVSLRHRTLSVTNGQWRTTTQSATGAPHMGTRRLNVEVFPTYDVKYDKVAPHGVRSFRGIECNVAQYPPRDTRCLTKHLSRA